MTLWPEVSWQERDIDILLLQEFATSSDFTEAFQRRIGRGPAPVTRLRHSVHERLGGLAWGETDIFLSFADGGHVLIENKITAPFQENQAERYRARAAHHSQLGIAALTVLIAPESYTMQVSPGDWNAIIPYEALAEMIIGQDTGSRLRAQILRNANTRATRLRSLSTDRAAQRAAGPELIAFKTEWFRILDADPVWQANPQKGANDEFLYRRRVNPFRLTIWHHPMAGYLSVQVPKDHAERVRDALPDPLPEGMKLAIHPKSVYLDVATPPIDMTSGFSSEAGLVMEALQRAAAGLDLVEGVLTLR
ncbi:MAG: PD-(D/E)XK nuclease family protein [Roseinatronobacter sp.]